MRSIHPSYFLKSSSLLKFLTLISFCYAQSVFAANITSPQSSTFTFTSNNETLNVTGSGSINTTSTAAVSGGTRTGLSVVVETTSSSDGISSSGDRALDLQNSTLSNLQVNQGTISSGSTQTAYLGGFATTSTISVGRASGGTATISNSASSGTVIYAFAPSADITFNIGATGSVLANNDAGSTAVFLWNTTSGTLSNVVLTNNGRINSDGSLAYAIVTNRYNATVINNGIINGEISFGNVFGTSSLTLNSGSTTNSNITFGAMTNAVIYNGGTYTGTINGLSDGYGTLTVNENLTLNGDVGNLFKLDSINVAAAKTLNSDTNNNIISANNITLNAGSNLIIGDGATTGIISGATSGIGNVTLNQTGSSLAVNSIIGDTNGVASLIVNNSSDGGSTNFSNSIKASAITFNALHANGATFSANANLSYNGAITLGSGATLTLNNNNSTSTINGSAAGNGILSIASDAAISSVGNIGSNFALNSIVLNDASSSTLLDLGNHDATAGFISIGDAATLQVGNSTIDAEIRGSGDSTINSSGDAIFVKKVGTASNILHSFNTAAGQSSTFQDDANIAEILVRSGSTLTANKSISAGSGSTAIILDGGYLDLQDGSSITGSINDGTESTGEIYTTGDVSLGAIGNSARVALVLVGSSSNATFNNDIHSNQVTISGNAIFTQASTQITSDAFTIQDGGAITLTLSSPSTTSLQVVGSAFMGSSTTLNLTISGTIASGTVYTLLDASDTSTLATVPDANININNSGTNIFGGNSYSTSISGNQLLLTAMTTVSPTQNFNSNERNSYDAIIGSSSATGNLATLKNFLQNNAVSSSSKQAAAKSATTQADNAINRINFNNIDANATMLTNRVNNIRSGIASGENGSNKNVWAQAFGATINQGNTSASDGYNARSSGLAFGFDREIRDNLILGFGGAYNHTNIDSRDVNKNSSIDSYQLSIYSGFTAEKFFINSIAGFAMNEYKSRRFIPLAAAQASASYSGESYSARAEIGTNLYLKNEVIFTPTLTFTAAQNQIDSYSEGGAGTLNLQVRNDRANFFEGRVGAQVSKFFKTSDGKKFAPNFGISYGYDFAGNKQKSTSSFVGQNLNFSTSGARIAQGSLKITAGVALYNSNNTTLSVNYNFDHRNDYNAHSGWLNAKLAF